jgi:hypothetical protein
MRWQTPNLVGKCRSRVLKKLGISRRFAQKFWPASPLKSRRSRIAVASPSSKSLGPVGYSTVVWSAVGPWCRRVGPRSHRDTVAFEIDTWCRGRPAVADRGWRGHFSECGPYVSCWTAGPPRTDRQGCWDAGYHATFGSDPREAWDITRMWMWTNNSRHAAMKNRHGDSTGVHKLGNPVSCCGEELRGTSGKCSGTTTATIYQQDRSLRWRPTAHPSTNRWQSPFLYHGCSARCT